MQLIYDMPARLLNAHFHSCYSIATFLIDDGFKSTRWNKIKECWEMDDAEYTWFMMRWS
jgi:hypothetical protein